MWVQVLWLAVAGCSGPSTDDKLPVEDTGLLTGPYTDWVDPVSSALRKGIPGAQIREGWVEWLKQQDCEPLLLETFTCHGAHPKSPYANIQFPEDDDGLTNIPDYQLGQDEAVIWVGMTPPSGRYFSWNHHQYNKYVPDSDPITTFATNSPSLHHLDVKTGPSPVAPWDAYTIVVHTANATTAQRVRDLLAPLLESAGQPADIVNVVPIAYQTKADRDAMVADGTRDADELFELNPGYGDADTQTMVLRVAAPDDLADPYLTTEHVRAAAFKLAFDDAPAYDPFPWPDMPPDDVTEESQGVSLRTAQQIVMDRVLSDIVHEDLEYIELVTENGPQKTSADCINLLDKCGGNNDDARYLRTARRMAIPDVDEPFASVFVVGINHSEVRDRNPSAPRSIYNSVTLNNFTRGVGVASRLDSELTDNLRFWFSTSQLPTLTDDQWRSIYVLQFARDCSQFPAPNNPWCIDINDDVLGICPFDKFWIVERVYLNQTTLTAPSASSLWAAMILAVGPDIQFVETPGPSPGAYYLNAPPNPLPDFDAWCGASDTTSSGG